MRKYEWLLCVICINKKEPVYKTQSRQRVVLYITVVGYFLRLRNL